MIRSMFPALGGAGVGALALVVVSVVCVASAFAALPANAAGASREIFPFPVHQKTLGNGFQVLSIPYDSPGVVAFFVVVRTGSREEVEAGHSGFAHFFEHMMFRGTPRYPQDAYNDVLKKMGADSNASTSDDWTRYYLVGPSRALETIMDVESDRFKNLKYSEDAFKTEALAVLGEYNKNVAAPGFALFERMRETAFTRHTYGHTTMGYLADIQAMPTYYDYSLRFFDRFYRPENCILLVVGDATPERVFGLAEKYWGDWKPGMQPVTIPAEPVQTAARGSHIDWPSPTRPYAMIGYQMPAFDPKSVDTAALDVAAQLLFASSAPLYQELVVDKQWVDFVGGDASFHRDPYLFTINYRARSNELLPQVREAIDRALENLKTQPVDPARLERVKSYLRYEFATGLNSPSAIAFSVSAFLTLTGDVSSINALYEQYEKVTPADVQRVARQIFVPERATTVTLTHRPAGGEAKP